MQKNDSNKLVSLLVAVLMLINCTTFFAAAETGSNVVYCSTDEVTAGSTAEIPFYLSNNSGIAGFVIFITFDPEVFTPLDVTDTGGIIQGKTLNSIGGNFIGLPENTVKVFCYGDQNFTDDGLLFTVKLNVNPNASGSTVLYVSYDPNDTIDEDINDVELSCSDVSLTVNNPGIDQLPQIELTAEETNDDECVVVRGYLREPNGLTSARIDLTYDSSSFEYVSMSGAVTVLDFALASDLISFSLSDIDDLDRDDMLFEIVFEYTQTASDGRFQFAATAGTVVGASSVYFVNCTFEASGIPNSSAIITSVGGLAGNFGQTVTVPIIIQDNPGLMGYKLSFGFDADDVSPLTVTNDMLFPAGSFGDNIGVWTDSFNVLWNGIDAYDENGQLFYITFEIATDEVKDTIVTVKYSRPDTYDGEYNDVRLICSDVVISLNSLIIYGDADGDGAINTVDLTLIRQYLADSTTVVSDGADVDGDGTINTLDLTLIRQYLADSDTVLGPAQTN